MKDSVWFDEIYNKDFRAKLVQDPKKQLAKLIDISTTPEVQYKVVKSTKNTVFMVIPHKEYLLSEAEITNINAAGTTSSIGSASTAGSLGSVCTSFSSASTALTAGSAGSVDL